MILELPLLYSVSHIPARCRTKTTTEILERVPVEVPEVAAADAPLALRCEPFMHDTAVKEADGLVDVRTMDGALWRRSTIYEEGAYRPARAADLDGLARGRQEFGFPYLVWQLHEASPASVLAGSRFPDATFEAQRTAALAEVHRMAARLLVVDGEVWQRTVEPVIHLVYTQSEAHMKVVRADQIDPNAPPSRYWRLDRRDDAMTAVETFGLDCDVPKAEVMRPDVLCFAYDMRPRLDKLAHQIREDMASDLVTAPLSFMAAYAELRDALDADVRDHDAIARILGGRCADALAARGREHLSADLHTALADWHGRADAPIDDAAIAKLLP